MITWWTSVETNCFYGGMDGASNLSMLFIAALRGQATPAANVIAFIPKRYRHQHIGLLLQLTLLWQLGCDHCSCSSKLASQPWPRNGDPVAWISRDWHASRMGLTQRNLSLSWSMKVCWLEHYCLWYWLSLPLFCQEFWNDILSADGYLTARMAAIKKINSKARMFATTTTS